MSAVRVGRFSVLWRPRCAVVLAIGAALAVLVAAANIGRGDYPLPLGEVLAVLAGWGDRAQRFVLLDLRLPRTLTGLLVGAALAASGAITQRVVRNPLASPDLLGVTGGASAAAVGALTVFGGTAVGVPAANPPSSAAAGAVVYALAYRGGMDGGRLVLVGVGVNAVATALTSWLLVVADVTQAGQATVWLTGSLAGREWRHALPVAAVLAALLPFAPPLGFALTALRFGDDTARGLGVRVDRARAALVVVALILAAVATAAAGPIAFVALVVPQVCQRLVGTPDPPPLTSACYGALLTVSADLVARTLLPGSLPVGVITAVLGAPYLLFLLIRRATL